MWVPCYPLLDETAILGVIQKAMNYLQLGFHFAVLGCGAGRVLASVGLRHISILN